MMEHGAGLRRTIAAIVLWSNGLALAAAGETASPPPPRLTVEEALRQAARVSFADEQPGVQHRLLQRRARGADGVWSDWADVATSEASGPVAVIDRGPGGQGLAPADYAYRARSAPGAANVAPDAWSEWSEPVEFTLPPQCAGGADPPGNEAPGALPTVVIGDLDGNGRYTGADVWNALQRCSKLGGCVLEALPVTYDDVAISFYGGPGGGNFPCYTWNALVCEPMLPFPNGLVIQGHGSATVFRSPVWRTPYKPSPIFEFWHAPGVQLRFRNFTLDGRKREQPDPTPGVNDIAGWRHRGVDVTHAFGPDHSLHYPNGCVHNLTVRDFLLDGIDVDHTRNWRIEYNRVLDIGCWKGLTECPRLHIPDTNPPPQWGCAGQQAGGYGISVGNYAEDTQVAHNEITRVGKMALNVKGGSLGVDPITRLSLHDNFVSNVGTIGIFVAGAIDSVIERNRVDGTHTYGCRDGNAWATWGIQTHGAMRNTRIQDNTLRNLASGAIGVSSVAENLVFANNQIDNVCVERTVKVGSTQAAIQFGEGSSGNFTLSRNEVKGNHCSMALAVCWGSQAQVTVDGGYYSTAENSDSTFGALYVESGHSERSPRVRLRGGAVFDYLGALRRPGIVASGNGVVVVEDDSVQVNKYREPFSTIGSAMDGRSAQKIGSIIRCGSSRSNPECQ